MFFWYQIIGFPEQNHAGFNIYNTWAKAYVIGPTKLRPAHLKVPKNKAGLLYVVTWLYNNIAKII